MFKKVGTDDEIDEKDAYLQGMRYLLSLISDHNLDHFFHDRELITITTENDHDLFNFLFPQLRSFDPLHSSNIYTSTPAGIGC